MNAHGSLCFHDALACEIDLDVDAGITDPTLACFYPDLALAHMPRICILRPDDWREAMAEFTGDEISDEVAAIANANVDRVANTLGTLSVAFESLEDNGQVARIVELCVGKPASTELIQIFQGLKIEQHLSKHLSARAPSPSM